MINEKDLQISSLSYTNKDFQKIYPELLDIAKNLTSKWQPNQSNESDPGVVLLKQLAFMGDKLSYNSDKTSLNWFLPSVTQESAMRYLCEINNYYPRYYNAATTNITVNYNGTLDENTTITLEALSTVFSDIDNDVVYTLGSEDMKFTSKEKSQTKLAYQGYCNTLTINDNTILTLDNIDSNNRIYFNETNVAENGIFISNNTDKGIYWKKVENLNTQTLGQYIYKFGYDSYKQLPYVEFPDDITTLIGDGIIIKYISTQGESGNISANTLTTITSSIKAQTIGATSDTTIQSSEFTINNYSSTSNGKDPETIDEAYNSFRKTVGLNETLTTCRDYQNYIYSSLYNILDEHYVSNVQVSDRRDDINYSNNITTLDENGVSIQSSPDINKITPFDLVIYPLKNVNIINSQDTYNATFTNANNVSEIGDSLENSSTNNISHNYIQCGTSDIFIIKNLYNLDVKITTTYKVNTSEEEEIINNIKQALYDKYSARQVDYGYALPYDILYETIENADSRIKNVRLAEPIVAPKILNKEGGEVENGYIDITAKNVLAGRTPLFDIYNDLTFEFNETTIANFKPVYQDVTNITTQANINISANNSYTLRKNEIVQILQPSYETIDSYGLGSKITSSVEINADVPFTLGSSDTITIKVDNSTYIYTANALTLNTIKIKDYATPPQFKSNVSIEANKETTLSTSDTLNEIGLINYEIARNLKCFWYLNTEDNILFKQNTTSGDDNPDGIKEVILNNNEYFFYTNEDNTQLYILGSGTKLALNDYPTNDWQMDKSSLDLTNVANDGLKAFTDSMWQIKDLTINTLTITENTIITLIEGDTIQSTQAINLGNTFNYAADANVISYVSGSEKTTINTSSYIKSRLDLNCSKEVGQRLLSNQSITLGSTELSGSDESENNYVLYSSNLLQLVGGDNLTIPSTTFKYINKQSINIPDTNTGLERNIDNFLVINASSITSNYTLNLIASNEVQEDKIYILTVCIQNNNDTITFTTDIGTINYLGTSLTSLPSKANGLYTLEIPSKATKLIITPSASNSAIIKIGIPTIKLGLSSNLHIDDETTLMNKIKELTTTTPYYFNHPIDTSLLIIEDDLTSAEAYFDVNNIANKFTISQIDFTNSSIKIIESSKLK